MRLRSVILAVFCLPWASMSMAQSTSAVITKGERADFYIIIGASGVRNVNISPDGKWLGGSWPSDAGSMVPGFIYDFAKDSTWITETPTEFIISPSLYAGDGYIFRDGELLEVETYMESDDAYYGSSSSWAISASLDTLFSMSHETVADPFDGAIRNVNYAYLVDGHTGKIMHRVEPYWPMSPTEENRAYGDRVNGASADGLILAGHSTNPDAWTNWSPVIWDLAHDTSFAIGEEEVMTGSLQAVNAAGTVIGSAEGYLIFYDRENLTYTREEVPLAPGRDGAGIVAISQDGWVLMYQEAGMGDREGYMYNYHSKQLVSIAEYVEELYGLVAPISYYTPMDMSDDGRAICGWSAYQGAYVPYCVKMGEEQVFARPRNFLASQAAGQLAVALDWQEPLKGQYTLKGYNVYCDSVQINAELIPEGEQEYLQTEGVEQGIHEYSVQAVYEEGLSAFTEPVRLLIVDENGCFPVQEIGSAVTYNRFVNIYWGLPSAQLASGSRSKSFWDGTVSAPKVGEVQAKGRMMPANASKSYQNDRLDLIDYTAMKTYGYSSAVLDGNRLYVASYNSSAITEYRYPSMDIVETYVIDGAREITNMALADGQFYLATSEEEILIVDKATMTVSNRIPTRDATVTHLCYIPELDGGKGGFAYGTWTSLQFCNAMGQAIDPGFEVDITDLSISGSAYCDGKLYLFSQSGEKNDELYIVDFATGQYIGKKVLSEDPRLGAIDPSYGFVAGGLSSTMLSDSTQALVAMLQFSANNSHFAVLEAKSAPKVLGYNLYRNGVKLNPDGEYIHGLGYEEAVYEPGTYVYTVEVVNEGNCIAEPLDGVETTVVISPAGECSAPASLTAVESNAAVMLDWVYNGGNGPALVGFNVYRDGELMAEELLDIKYTDNNVPEGEHVYRIEAYHNNSCVASDSVKIDVTHEGTMMPPSAFVLHHELSGDAVYNVEADWELPFFEAPLAVGYCGMPYSGTALTEGQPMWCLIGWDSAGLDPYRDLYIVGMEFFIGEGITNLEGLVYLNDTMALRMPMFSRVKENEWNTLMFNQYIPMDQPMEALVGYRVEYSDKTLPVAVFDMGPAKTGYGDLLSTDGQQWSTLTASGVSSNWCINALVVRKRDMEKAAMQGLDRMGNPLVKTMRLGKFGLTGPKAVASPKITSESVKLQGFNIYRDDVKLNEELLTDRSYVDSDVPEGSYEYYVSAVYSDGEVAGEPVLIDVDNVANETENTLDLLVLSPNPASDYVRIQGSYATLEVVALSGQVVAFYSHAPEVVPVASWNPGLYLCRFTMPDGSVTVRKLLIQR